MGWRSYPLIDERSEPDAFSPRSVPSPAREPATASVRAPVQAYGGFAPASKVVYDDGEKFPGGFGPTQLLVADYWTLRARSSQLFETNLYARGLIRRLVTNEINVGLFPEATPEEKILGVPEQSLTEWSEEVETRWSLWASEPWLCDEREQDTFGALQAAARMESLVAGDVLVVMRQFATTGLPRIHLINGAKVRTPYNANTEAKGKRIVEGVELDAHGRQVAYWVQLDDGTSKRLPAWGEKSGRRLAWLVYGTDKRHESVRGKPLLSLILQSMRELDRYRDAAVRKAVINSMVAGFIKKNAPVQGSRLLTSGGGAVRAGVGMLPQESGETAPREFAITELIPGMYLQELAEGEEPHAMNANGTDEKFGVFQEAILAAVAWANEVPPEIMTLSFSSNYSASQAAINEFKMYLNKVRTNFGAGFCHPIYTEWLLAQVLSGKIQAAGFIESWRNPKQHDLFGAWTYADWAGAIKPAVDMSKLVGGYEKKLSIGAITRARTTRELTGMKFSKVMKQLRRENEQLADALAPLNQVNGIAPAPSEPESELDKDGQLPEDSEQKKDDDDVADR